MTSSEYIGGELEFFAYAQNWKRYLRSQLTPYLKGRVLEVGAGLGATTGILARGSFDSWVCLEPDTSLREQIEERIALGELPPYCSSLAGTVQEIPSSERFDSILYIDVLEHIQDGRQELKDAILHLEASGNLIVLSPAWQFLYSPFDREIGHFLRYNKRTLRGVVPEGVTEVRLIYLDSVGLFASLANSLFLRQRMPTLKQILFWDRVMIPVSRLADVCLAYRFGKSVLGIWRAD